jgi:hypothetical protein
MMMMKRKARAAAVLAMLALAAGCAAEPVEQQDDDRFSIDAALPRSGDPAHPNVKVEVTVIDVTSERGLTIRASLAGKIVRGILDLKTAIGANARTTRARSRTATFIIVQAGRSASIALTDDARALCGPWAGLRVHVFEANANGADVALEPFVSPTTDPGESLEGSTRVRVASGEAVVLGGYRQERDRSGRAIGRAEESSGTRDVLAVLTVTVIG